MPTADSHCAVVGLVTSPAFGLDQASLRLVHLLGESGGSDRAGPVDHSIGVPGVVLAPRSSFKDRSPRRWSKVELGCRGEGAPS
jgi:hypothetical protein